MITNGFRLAGGHAAKVLREMAREIPPQDAKTLNRIAVTAINSKAVAPYKEKIGAAAVQSVAEERDSRYIADINDIKVETKAGRAVTDLEFLEGTVLDPQRLNQRMPRRVEKAL